MISVQGLCHLRHSGEQVPDKSIVSNLEDRGLGVLVDSDNDLRTSTSATPKVHSKSSQYYLAVLHTSKMLNGSTDAHSHVELRRNDLASLPNL